MSEVARFSKSLIKPSFSPLSSSSERLWSFILEFQFIVHVPHNMWTRVIANNFLLGESLNHLNKAERCTFVGLHVNSTLGRLWWCQAMKRIV